MAGRALLPSSVLVRFVRNFISEKYMISLDFLTKGVDLFNAVSAGLAGLLDWAFIVRNDTVPYSTL